MVSEVVAMAVGMDVRKDGGLLHGRWPKKTLCTMDTPWTWQHLSTLMTVGAFEVSVKKSDSVRAAVWTA